MNCAIERHLEVQQQVEERTQKHAAEREEKRQAEQREQARQALDEKLEAEEELEKEEQVRRNKEAEVALERQRKDKEHEQQELHKKLQAEQRLEKEEQARGEHEAKAKVEELGEEGQVGVFSEHLPEIVEFKEATATDVFQVKEEGLPSNLPEQQAEKLPEQQKVPQVEVHKQGEELGQAQPTIGGQFIERAKELTDQAVEGVEDLLGYNKKS